MCVSESNTVTHLDVSHSLTGLSHDPHALMTENLARAQEMLVCPAQTGMRRFDIDVRRAETTSRLISDDLALFGAAVYIESNAAHDGC
jgi:hypothetical protein